MGDVLALLDAAASRVSAVLVPAGLSSLVTFLRGMPWETATGSTNDSTQPMLPNLLIGAYGFIPLAIAPHALLVSVAALDERSALTQYFERCEFHVVSVNLVPDKHHSDFSHRSGRIVREECMDAIQAWCDAVLSEESVPTSQPNRKRARTHDVESCATNVPASRVNSMANGGAWRGQTRSDCVAVRRVLCLVHCSAEAAAARRSGRRGGDVLIPFLHDIAATAALCRAKQEGQSVHVRLSVLLVPSDHVYGGVRLESELSESLGTHFCVRLFNPTATDGPSDAEAEAFRHRIAAMCRPIPNPTREEEAVEGKRDTERHEESTWIRDSSLFFVRRDNLPLCCFLHEALRRFPVVLSPPSLRQLQSLWATRRQVGDVVLGLHALLAPFTHSTPAEETREFPLTPNGRDATDDGMCRLGDSVDLLNALLDAAAQWADGHPINESIAFAVLYEDLVWRRTLRLQRLQGVVDVLRRMWQRITHTERDAEVDPNTWDFHLALERCVPVHVPRGPGSLVLPRNAPDATETDALNGTNASKAVVSLPPTMALSSVRVSLNSEMLHAALLAVKPPEESLEELLQCVASSENGENIEDGDHVSLSNFFSPCIPDSVRVLHLLAAHSIGRYNVRDKFLPISILRRVCQMSDEALVRALKELQLAGLVLLNGREMKARILLEA